MSCQDILNAVFSEQLVIEKMYYKVTLIDPLSSLTDSNK